MQNILHQTSTSNIGHRTSINMSIVKFFCPYTFYKIRTTVPAIIIIAPIAILGVRVSPKNMTENIIAMATLILSTGATCETLPSCRALK
jgi:hypothetical protein